MCPQETLPPTPQCRRHHRLLDDNDNTLLNPCCRQWTCDPTIRKLYPFLVPSETSRKGHQQEILTRNDNKQQNILTEIKNVFTTAGDEIFNKNNWNNSLFFSLSGTVDTGRGSYLNDTYVTP